MSITNLIEDALKNVQLPSYYLERFDSTEEAIVYSYIETPSQYGDLKETATKYIVLLNVYCKSKIEIRKKYIKDAMLEYGFKKVTILGTKKEKNDMYNTAMQFKIGVINQD